MNVLIIAANGREHALATMYAKSKKVKKVVMTPGNGLTDFENSKIKNYLDVDMMDFNKIVEVCKKEKIDLVDVAQDDAIAAGFVEKFEKLGIKAFGPTQKASQLEWDKEWARNFMMKYGLPIPEFKSFSNHEEAIIYINSTSNKLLFIKAAGLAMGKGVIRAENKNEAIEAVKEMKTFGKSGETFLIEEGLIGEEFSLFVLCDGKDYQIVSWAQDHKTVYDGDVGPNTGGMGSVAPAAVVNQKVVIEVEEKIIKPLMDGMKKEGRPYKGVLYLGGMIVKDESYSSNEVRSSRVTRTINPQVKVIEFNCRWGDPEAEVILPSIETDYVDVVDAILSGNLHKLKIKIDNKVRVSVAGCSRGYPTNYSMVKGKEIFGLVQAMELPGVIIFGAGIKREGKPARNALQSGAGGRFFANGGRIFHIVGEGETILQARVRAYGAMAMIFIEGNNLHYRTDIGWRDSARMRGQKI